MSSKNMKRGRRPVDQTNAKRVIFQMGKKTVILAIQPWLLSSIITALLFLAVFNVAATFYLFERDDLLANTAAANVDIRRTYEAKFQRFKTAMEVIQDQSSSERVKLAEELASISERQDLYASRHAKVAAVIDNARKMGIEVAAITAPKPTIKPSTSSILADSDISLTGDTTATGGQREFGQDTLNQAPNTLDEFEQESHFLDPFETIRRFESDLTAMEQLNAVSVQAVANAISLEHNNYRSALSDLPVKLKLPSKIIGIGGPFIPANFNDSELKKAAKQIDTNLRDITHLKRVARAVPLIAPLKHPVRSSSFGKRIDPFRKRSAFHSGMDFRAKTGTAVLATANGVVIRAGRSGGYGNLVEIRHAYGMSTRYAHLSRIGVKVGQKLNPGDMVGKVGSTGRSTGPHLHYEIRIGGKARNPLPFLKAGKKLPKT